MTANIFFALCTLFLTSIFGLIVFRKGWSTPALTTVNLLLILTLLPPSFVFMAEIANFQWEAFGNILWFKYLFMLLFLFHALFWIYIIQQNKPNFIQFIWIIAVHLFFIIWYITVVTQSAFEFVPIPKISENIYMMSLWIGMHLLIIIFFLFQFYNMKRHQILKNLIVIFLLAVYLYMMYNNLKNLS